MTTISFSDAYSEGNKKRIGIKYIIKNGRRRRALSGVFRRRKRSLNKRQAEAQQKIRRVRIFCVVRGRLREAFFILFPISCLSYVIGGDHSSLVFPGVENIRYNIRNVSSCRFHFGIAIVLVE